jgi:MYXO-CTERM domain-containing protein
MPGEDAGVMPGRDAGSIAPGRDGGGVTPGRDGGTTPPTTGDDDGCDCSATSSGLDAAWIAVVLFGLWSRRRKTRP